MKKMRRGDAQRRSHIVQYKSKWLVFPNRNLHCHRCVLSTPKMHWIYSNRTLNSISRERVCVCVVKKHKLRRYWKNNERKLYRKASMTIECNVNQIQNLDPKTPNVSRKKQIFWEFYLSANVFGVFDTFRFANTIAHTFHIIRMSKVLT